MEEGTLFKLEEREIFSVSKSMRNLSIINKYRILFHSTISLSNIDLSKLIVCMIWHYSIYILYKPRFITLIIDFIHF